MGDRREREGKQKKKGTHSRGNLMVTKCDGVAVHRVETKDGNARQNLLKLSASSKCTNSDSRSEMHCSARRILKMETVVEVGDTIIEPRSNPDDVLDRGVRSDDGSGRTEAKDGVAERETPMKS